MKLTIGQAGRFKKMRSNHKHPDWIMLEPRGIYHGFVFELKKNYDELYTKKGELRQDEHTLEQLETLKKLRSKGYLAEWGYDFDKVKKTIDWYMSL